MRILITGASGLLGEALVRRLATDHEITGWCFSQKSGPFTAVDIRDPAHVNAAFRMAAPNLVIHSAAARDPDWCETSFALDAAHLSPGPPFPQKPRRPTAVVLSKDRLTAAGFRELPPFEQGVKQLLLTIPQ